MFPIALRHKLKINIFDHEAKIENPRFMNRLYLFAKELFLFPCGKFSGL
jgi:hypothetical protein